MKQSIILANGAFPTRDEALQAMLQTPLLICCDGAYSKLVESGLFSHAEKVPDIHVVGDGDSLKEDSDVDLLKPRFVNGYVDQETNDLTKAVRYALSLGVNRIVILGATGLREDHTLGNISLLVTYASMTAADGTPLKVRMYTDYGYFIPVNASATFPSFPRQQVSLFSMDSNLLVSSEGLKYPLHRRPLHQWWEATLNEALGESFTLQLEGSGVLLLYQTHEAK